MTDRALNIAIVHTTLPGANLPRRGGVAYVVHRLANQLADKGHTVTVFAADPAPPDARYKVMEMPAPRWATHSFLGRLLIVPLCLNRIRWSAFDVVHTHGDDSLLFSSRRRVRSLHGSALGEFKSAKRLRRRLSQALLYPFEIFSALTAREAIAQSEATKRDFPFVRTVVHYAVDTSLFRPGIKSVNPSILFIGTLGGRKRGQLLVDAFAREIVLAIPRAELWLAADQHVGHPSVRNLGWIPDDETLAKLMREAWVVCMPSDYEGFGIPYLEGLASGAVVVATANPGALEVLENGKYGVLCDPVDLGTTLVKVLSDRELRASYEGIGTLRAAHFSWERATSEYLKVYERVVPPAI